MNYWRTTSSQLNYGQNNLSMFFAMYTVTVAFPLFTLYKSLCQLNEIYLWCAKIIFLSTQWNILFWCNNIGLLSTSPFKCIAMSRNEGAIYGWICWVRKSTKIWKEIKTSVKTVLTISKSGTNITSTYSVLWRKEYIDYCKMKKDTQILRLGC